MVAEDSQELQEDLSSSEEETLTLDEQVDIIKDWMKNHATLPEVIGKFYLQAISLRFLNIINTLRKR